MKNAEDEKKYYIDKLRDLLESHSSAITRNHQYLGYGILIALFHYGKPFFSMYPFLSCLTAMLTVVSLVLIYTFSVYYYSSSEKILELEKKLRTENTQQSKKEEHKIPCQCNLVWIKELYTQARKKAKIIFWLFQLTIFCSVILFIISSGFHFFGGTITCK